MLFNSISFGFFFLIVTTFYFLLPHKYRWLLLLVASCCFYMAFIPVYILILFTTILVDYYAAIWIERSVGKKRKWYLIFSIASTCLILFFFKYFNFFNTNFAAIAHAFGLSYPIGFINIILPIGLSFHTFQSLSYVVEVYRGKQKAETNFGIYSLYVMFYPQLVAGPIERPQNLLHQFYEEHRFDYERVVSGLKLMAWGLFKKVVIADTLADYVNTVYEHPTNYTGLPLIVATVFFSFQIYCDFSGYSDIAIGTAEVMGFKLMRNFNSPYFSRSISEFWARWHISLSTWFKDYVYIPLGGNRVATLFIYMNLMITFLLSGFWHGAKWTYVIWGGLNGIFLIAGMIWRNPRNKLSIADRKGWFYDGIKITGTFTLIAFAWIFFRAKTGTDAIYVAGHLLNNLGSQLVEVVAFVRSHLGGGSAVMVNELIPLKYTVFCVLLIMFLLGVEVLQQRFRLREKLSETGWWVRWPIYSGCTIIILFFFIHGLGGGVKQFIYFQF